MFETIGNFFKATSVKKSFPEKKFQITTPITRETNDIPSHKRHSSYDMELDKPGVGVKWGETDNSNSGTQEAYKTILKKEMNGGNFKNRRDAIPFKKADPNFIGMSGDVKTYELNDEINLEKARKDIENIKKAA